MQTSYIMNKAHIYLAIVYNPGRF